MNNIEGITLGETIFKKLDTNPYLHELYENILYKYSMRLLNNTSEDYKPIDIEDALRFTDILSKSNDPVNSERHKIMAQEIVALLKNIHPQNPAIEFYLGSVLSSTGNFRGMTLATPNHQHGSLMDQFYNEFSKDYMSIPAAPESQFFRSQKAVYDRLYVDYNDTLEHRNIVISETLKVIEHVILFSISNYFLRFSSEYKRFHNVESFKMIGMNMWNMEQ